jgi:hypothetical protein
VSGYWTVPDDYACDPQITHGSTHSVSSDEPERDRVEDLRVVVEEVTRKPVQRQPKKLGFY